MMKDAFTQLGSVIASVMFVWAIFQQYFPYELRRSIEKYSQRLLSLVYPYMQIKFNEFTGERLMRSEAYSHIEDYLSSNTSMQAKRLKADIVRNSQSLALSMDDHEEVADEFEGVKLWWASGKNISKMQSLSFFPVTDEKRFYTLTFHKRHRDLILGQYLKHVIREGKAIKLTNRQRKLYTNSGSHWRNVLFEHPATFQTLAMDPEKKKEIIDDLVAFSKAENFYAEVGRAWKRGYLLYGPPGTGKSTMIAAMANLLGYDLYDLELTAVKDNTELRKLLIETTGKSIIVIEDIDCSVDLTAQRRNTKKKEDNEEKDPMQKLAKEETDSNNSKVTLSGLLNFVDGLWSACGGEKLIVFTTNHVEKLDPALIRKGRMDKHVEMPYCSFEAFKVLARNYLKIDSHHLFEKIHGLLEEINMTPADVAENLMPKSVHVNAETYLLSLIEALGEAKRANRMKAEEEAKEKESLGKGEEEKEKESSTTKETGTSKPVTNEATEDM
ncbi:AAA-ATPase ASD, mitochondrial-like [Diospyros lotus]|uniref:AAA-ATPase ASD, mitochondrial-like n=1 Tax=Diospyros lotus TaxID=55363 RepID=UPI00224C90C1|nr:AAA-ATPase ASD, mitochondrial-like [Diospyros lotus]